MESFEVSGAGWRRARKRPVPASATSNRPTINHQALFCGKGSVIVTELEGFASAADGGLKADWLGACANDAEPDAAGAGASSARLTLRHVTLSRFSLCRSARISDATW